MQQGNFMKVKLSNRNWNIMKFIYTLGTNPDDVTMKIYNDTAKWMPKITKDNVKNILQNAEIMNYYNTANREQPTKNKAHFKICDFELFGNNGCGTVVYCDDIHFTIYKIDEVWEEFSHVFEAQHIKLLCPYPSVFYGDTDYVDTTGKVPQHYISCIDDICNNMEQYVYILQDKYNVLKIDVELGEQHNIITKKIRPLYILIEKQKDDVQHLLFNEHHRFVLDILFALNLPFDMTTFRALYDFLPENLNDKMMNTIKENVKLLAHHRVSMGIFGNDTFVIPDCSNSLYKVGHMYHISRNNTIDYTFDITKVNNKVIPIKCDHARLSNGVNINDVVLCYVGKNKNITEFSKCYADTIKGLHMGVANCRQYGVAKWFACVVNLKYGVINLGSKNKRCAPRCILMCIPNKS